MAERLPEDGVKVEPATEGGQYEHVDLGDYRTEKARATLEIAKMIDDIGYPDDNKEALRVMDKETLNAYREAFYAKYDELEKDEEGKIKNEYRFLADLIGQRLAELDTLLSVRSSDSEFDKIFALKEAA